MSSSISRFAVAVRGIAGLATISLYACWLM
jgi:hypothetical protein